MQNTASEKTIRLTLRFVTALGFPALEYQARQIAAACDIELDTTISEEQGKYACALSADQIDSLATGKLDSACGYAFFA